MQDTQGTEWLVRDVVRQVGCGTGELRLARLVSHSFI